jgi:hypothetical protein
MIKHKAKWVTWFGVDGMTFGRHVFLNPAHFNNERLIRHEQAHVDQYARDGIVRFLARYIWEYACGLIEHCNHRDAYLNISYEVEARKKELKEAV